VFEEIGSFRGELLLDGDSRRAAARDAGGLVSLLPGAVLRPACIDDVVRAVRFCARRGIKIAARGRGHTTFGQAQVEGGLVIDTSSLDEIRSLSSERAVVDAGVTWRQLLTRSTAEGRAPPVLTGFQGLSVGGTLSVGGISGVSYNRGAQVDHVLALEVVTGDGNRMTCSAEHNGDLFNAVLASGGRMGVIVQATLPLVAAPTHVRHTLLSYSTLAPFLGDLRELVRRRSLDGVSGTICLDGNGGVRYELNAVSFFTAGRTPDTSRLLEGIGSEALRGTTDLEYVDYCLLVDKLIDRLEATGGWNERVHPWFDVFLPDACVGPYLREVLATLDPAKDVGPAELGSLGQIHLFPLRTEHLRRPWLRVPQGELVFLFDILTSSHTPRNDPAYRRQMLGRNRRLFERARSLGGTPYSISAIPLSAAERIEPMGDGPAEYEGLKRKYDPFRVLRELV
jgi:cytokinin dehydrogenase